MQNEIVDLSNKAKAEFQRNKFSEAVADFSTCLELLSQENNPVDIAEVRNNLSVVQLRNKQPQLALDAVLGIDQVFSDAGDIQKQGMALANTGSAYEALKQYDLAAKTYEQAIARFKQIGEKKYLSITLRSLSDLQLKKGNKFNALTNLQASYTEKPHVTFKDRFFSSMLWQLIQKILGH